MTIKTLIPLAVLALAAPVHALQQQTDQGEATAAPAPPARGGGAAPGAAASVRIAVANPSRIFSSMKETIDLGESLEAELGRLGAEEKEREEALRKLQSQRNQLKPETPQWEKANNDLMDGAGEFKLWREQNKARLDRTQKRQLRQLFLRIEQACREIAQRDGYDLVVADQRPALPDDLDQVNAAELRARINSRNVLYAAPKVDISDAVIALLDSKYKAKGGGAASPAPAGTGAASGARKPAAGAGSAPAAPRQPGGGPTGTGPGAGEGGSGTGTGDAGE